MVLEKEEHDDAAYKEDPGPEDSGLLLAVYAGGGVRRTRLDVKSRNPNPSMYPESCGDDLQMTTNHTAT